ncbi:c-type cytochrome domain-containing protein [Dokdonella sp.]|uniref:c-type cytochrome domain-containing protein n=1 Tax=Dokdonella sp. TaxID=2291710 RepID=UPI002F3F0D82
MPLDLVAAGLALALAAARADAGAPDGCTRIADIAPNYSITYGAAVQGLFDDYATNGGSAGCINCHEPPAPTGGLDLTAGVSWGHLVGVPSGEDASILYVVPGRPEDSLLFRKVNCDVPGVGARMPLDDWGGGLLPEQQALIYDWIANGALPGTSATVFRDGFDIRGFVP